jgi:hypothetical protein
MSILIIPIKKVFLAEVFFIGDSPEETEGWIGGVIDWDSEEDSIEFKVKNNN